MKPSYYVPSCRFQIRPRACTEQVGPSLNKWGLVLQELAIVRSFSWAEPQTVLQALNNWGLVLQELATMQSPADQATLVQQSIQRFRQAIRLRPDFDRACYNLGTVFYAHACSQQSPITQRLPSSLTKVGIHFSALLLTPWQSHTLGFWGQI
jgi:hypothetical protein